jgi:flagellin
MASFGDLNRVNTNVSALDAQLSLNKVNRDLAESQMRLSTGLNINRAEDNVAGYSIATRLKGRIAGLEQALQNVGDAKSVLDIAEASYDTIMDNIIEMKTLATQAANDTMGTTERRYISDQIEALANDINQIATQTVFQDNNLLDGSSFTFQVGERATDLLTADMAAVDVAHLFGAEVAGPPVTYADATLGDATAGVDPDGLGALLVGDAIRVDVSANGGQGELIFEGDSANPDAVPNGADFRSFLASVDTAIERMSDRVNYVGIQQSSLSVREETLSESISSNEAAKSRIIDTDFAKEQSKVIRMQILQQTATAALTQANMGPQAVLSFMGG